MATNIDSDHAKSLFGRIAIRDLSAISSPLIIESGSGSTFGYISNEEDKGKLSDDGTSLTGMLSELAAGSPFGPAPMWFTGIGAPLAVRSLSCYSEVDALCDYFYEKASRIAIEKELRPKLTYGGTAFYLVTNLIESNMQELIDSGYIQKKLGQLEEKLCVAMSGTKTSRYVDQCGIFTTDGIIKVAQKSEELATSISQISDQYNRLIFEIHRDGTFTVESALLDGHRCVRLGRSMAPASQISTPGLFSEDILREIDK